MYQFVQQSINSFLTKAGLLSMLGLLIGCQVLKDMGNIKPLDGVIFKLNYQPAKAQVQGLVLDAKTSEPLSIPVRVSILGKDASRTVTFSGKAQTSYIAPKGDVFIGLNGAEPTLTAPADLLVVLQAEGYVASSSNLSLTKSLNNPFFVRLLKRSAPPAGVAAQTATVITSSSGTLLTNQVIDLKIPTAVSPIPLQVSLGANTVMKDDKGQLVTGNLTAWVVAYSSQSQDALLTFPGGLSAPVTRNAQGATGVKGRFNPVGFVSIELKSGRGQAVASLSQPALVQMTISATSYNPQTNQVIKAGDNLEVYSYNDTTGEWTYERTVVAIGQAGLLAVAIPMTHVGSYVLTTPRSVETCQLDLKVGTLPANHSYLADLISFQGANQDRPLVIERTPSVSGDQLAITLINKQRYELKITDPLNGYLIGHLGKFTHTCTRGVTTAVSVPITPPAYSVNANFTIKAVCENGKRIEVYPTTNLYVRETANPSAMLASTLLKDGKGTLTGLTPNTNYQALVYYEGAFSKPFNSGSADSDQTLTFVLSNEVSVCNQ